MVKLNHSSKITFWRLLGDKEEKKIVGFMWIYTVKHKLYGTLNCYRVKVVQKIYI